MTASAASQHIVVPGQIIATSSLHDEENSFLRGHGTYLENVNNDTNYNDGGEEDDNNDHKNIQQDDTNGQQHQQQQQQQQQQHHLISSTTGTITRTNKLIQITPPNGPYNPQTGDPIIGRVTSISNQKWKISFNLNIINNTNNDTGGGGGAAGGGVSSTTMQASLPLTGIHMSDGVQRIRTNADALLMRTMLREGDLVSAEVRSVQSISGGGGTGGNVSVSGGRGGRGGGGGATAATAGAVAGGSGASAIGNVILHARSVRCGKLENGCFVMAPNWLIGRRKKQFVVLGMVEGNKNKTKKGFDGILVEVLLGCNGGIWIQLAMMELESVGGISGGGGGGGGGGGEIMVQEKVQKVRSAHARRDMTLEERIVVARVRNAIEALKLVYCKITPENIELVVAESVRLGYDVVDMLRHDVIAKITACTRNV